MPKRNLNKKYVETLKLIEDNISLICMTDDLNKELVKYIKYINIRTIINEGSLLQQYNVEYFGVKDNTNILLGIIEQSLLI